MISGKFRPKSRFSKISTKIEIFAHFDQNRDFRKIRSKSRFFCKFRRNRGATRISTNITGDPLHSRAACTQPCNVNTHSRAHCSPGARLCEQWGHGCVNNRARLCASARLCRGSPVNMGIFRKYQPNSRFFKNFDKRRDFWKTSTKIEILRKFRPK